MPALQKQNSKHVNEQWNYKINWKKNMVQKQPSEKGWKILNDNKYST